MSGPPPSRDRSFSPSPIYDIDNIKLDRVPGSVQDARSLPLVEPSPSRDSIDLRRQRVARKLDFNKVATTQSHVKLGQQASTNGHVPSSLTSSASSKKNGGGSHTETQAEDTNDEKQNLTDDSETEFPEQKYEEEEDQAAKLLIERESIGSPSVPTATTPTPSASSSADPSSIPGPSSNSITVPPTTTAASSSSSVPSVASSSAKTITRAEAEEDESRRVATRKYAHEDSFHPNWPKHKKHIFILSNAGKPVYSRYGDESGLSSVMGLLQALVSSVADSGDVIRHVVAGELRIVFVLRGPFYLVCVSQTAEPLGQLEQQLQYACYQIISTLTAGIFRVYQNRSAFDVRHLLTGTERVLDSLIHRMNYDASFLLDSIHCLRVADELRNDISAHLQHHSHPELTFAMMMAHQKLISLVRPSKYTLSATDLHLLMNFVHSSTSFRGGQESWTPFCLPQFNEKGFMWLYVIYVAPEVCLMLLSPRQDNFYHMSQCRSQIMRGIRGTLLNRLLETAVAKPFYSVRECGIEGLRHFLYKSKLISQFTCPSFEHPYNTKRQAKRLYRQYQHVRSRIIPSAPVASSSSAAASSSLSLAGVIATSTLHHKVYYFSSQSETILGWVTGGFELYATFSPVETKAVCIRACNSLLSWIKRCEGSLFVLSSPVF